MISKNALEKYVMAVKQANETMHELSDVLQKVNSDNYIIDLMPSVISKEIDNILSEILTPEKFDWLNCGCGNVISVLNILL